MTPLAAVLASYDSCGTTQEPVSFLPAVYTDYRTPGNWTTNLNFGWLPSHIQRDLWKPGNYLAGRTYTDLFGSAVAGPGNEFPAIDGSNVIYGPGNLFSDPVVRTGFDCEGKAQVKLNRSAILIKSQQLTFCGKITVFSAHVKKLGWFTLNATATRWNPSGSLPAGYLLSTKVSMIWHFKFAPVSGHTINAQAVPVTVTRFLPQGLGFGNDATSGATTPVRFVLLRGGGMPAPTPDTG